MPKYEFTEEEVTALLQSLDITCKAQGLVSAGACLTLAQKLKNPIKDAPIEPEKTEG